MTLQHRQLQRQPAVCVPLARLAGAAVLRAVSVLRARRGHAAGRAGVPSPAARPTAGVERQHRQRGHGVVAGHVYGLAEPAAARSAGRQSGQRGRHVRGRGARLELAAQVRLERESHRRRVTEMGESQRGRVIEGESQRGRVTETESHRDGES